MAQMRVPLPWTPVPITGQTFAVLLSGVFLGRRWGGISQTIYLGLGALGLPWFSGWTGGYGAIWGPTGGYLLGFIPAALFVGYLADTPVEKKRFVSFLGLMVIANFGLIHAPGLLHLRLWYGLMIHEPARLGQILMTGTVPFIAGDVIKILAASGIAAAIAPRRPNP
jgi:biotin transport system substrate-specific component